MRSDRRPPEKSVKREQLRAAGWVRMDAQGAEEWAKPSHGEDGVHFTLDAAWRRESGWFRERRA
jgi:hypothetical protein